MIRIRGAPNGAPLSLSFSLDGDEVAVVTGPGVGELVHEAASPPAGFDELTYELVLSEEDATLSILGGVAWMDADALEHRDV